jgi:ATP-dependent Clp protease ATP-binding subunit ClpA
MNGNNRTEGSYEALNRYARNLNDLAAKGKLDPVIGMMRSEGF